EGGRAAGGAGGFARRPAGRGAGRQGAALAGDRADRAGARARAARAGRHTLLSPELLLLRLEGVFLLLDAPGGDEVVLGHLLEVVTLADLVGQDEPLRVLAREEHVPLPFHLHDGAGGGDGVLDVADVGDGAGPLARVALAQQPVALRRGHLALHDGGIEAGLALAVQGGPLSGVEQRRVLHRADG